MRHHCALASLAAGESQAGTAPTARSWLFVEQPGPWGAYAVSESRLPKPVALALEQLADVRVQLIRRPVRRRAPGVTVVAAHFADDSSWVETTVVSRPEDVLSLDLDALVRGETLGLTPTVEPTWMVCTNGRRDRCCAKYGRPVVQAVAKEWPSSTWETTHLGGHRFAATMLALPSGEVLGRLDTGSVVEVCRQVLAGTVPTRFSRGRVGSAGETLAP